MKKLLEELSVDGSFRVKLRNPGKGKHTAEVRFVEGGVGKKISFEVVDSRTKIKSALASSSIFAILLSLLLLCLFLALR